MAPSTTAVLWGTCVSAAATVSLGGETDLERSSFRGRGWSWWYLKHVAPRAQTEARCCIVPPRRTAPVSCPLHKDSFAGSPGSCGRSSRLGTYSGLIWGDCCYHGASLAWQRIRTAVRSGVEGGGGGWRTTDERSGDAPQQLLWWGAQAVWEDKEQQKQEFLSRLCTQKDCDRVCHPEKKPKTALWRTFCHKQRFLGESPLEIVTRVPHRGGSPPTVITIDPCCVAFQLVLNRCGFHPGYWSSSGPMGSCQGDPASHRSKWWWNPPPVWGLCTHTQREEICLYLAHLFLCFWNKELI